jgi:hypothetical protein
VAVNAELYPWLSAGAIAWGVADCFFGYRIFKVTITVWGVILGMVFGQAAGKALDLGTAGQIGGVLVGGLAGGGLAYLLYLAAVFVAGFFLGATLGLLFLSNLNHNVAMATSCVLGVIGGYLAVKMQRVVLILATALVGSFRALLALMYFTQHLDWMYYLGQRPQRLPDLIESNSWLLPSVLALAAVGVMVQFELGARSGANSKSAARGKE